MNIIVLIHKMQGPVKIHLDRNRLAIIIALMVMLPCAITTYLGYQWGSQTEADMRGGMQAQAAPQDEQMEEDARASKEHLNALASRLGALQAHIIRLDALGERLVKMARLEKGEFDFSQPPPEGGPEVVTHVVSQQLGISDFLQSLDSLSRLIDDRAQKLNVLESLYMNRNLLEETLPSGLPVQSGWISSYFGVRIDPFTGRLAKHEGVDIAGAEGSPVNAVAAGVVTWAGPRFGYGNLVEVNHGNGFVTRYAHNDKTMVVVGQTISKGQALATMGSTGRSTGPHVHFEILRNGSVINPIKYIAAVQ